MGNIDSRMSPFRIFQADICKCTVQSNSALPVFAAHFSGCWGHSQPCQWALCCSVPSPVTPRKKPFLARVESLPVTSRSYARTDNYNLSITIYIIVASSWGQQLHGRMLPSAIIVIVANLCFFCSTVIM